MERDPNQGWITRVTIDAVDAVGRRLLAVGEPVSRMFINRHTFIDINSLVRWDVGGETAWGEDQDMWPVHAFAAERAAHRRRRIRGPLTMTETPPPGQAKMAEAELDDEMLARMRSLAGTNLRIDHSVNNEEATRLAVERFADAIGDPNPLWRDRRHAETSVVWGAGGAAEFRHGLLLRPAIRLARPRLVSLKQRAAVPPSRLRGRHHQVDLPLRGVRRTEVEFVCQQSW